MDDRGDRAGLVHDSWGELQWDHGIVLLHREGLLFAATLTHSSAAAVVVCVLQLAFFYGGMVRSMNLISTLLQSFVIMGLIIVLWTIVGYSLAFGKDAGSVIGDPSTFLFLRDVGGAPSM
jgi:ammonia channel protein AmtB